MSNVFYVSNFSNRNRIQENFEGKFELWNWSCSSQRKLAELNRQVRLSATLLTSHWFMISYCYEDDFAFKAQGGVWDRLEQPPPACQQVCKEPQTKSDKQGSPNKKEHVVKIELFRHLNWDGSWQLLLPHVRKIQIF